MKKKCEEINHQLNLLEDNIQEKDLPLLKYLL